MKLKTRDLMEIVGVSAVILSVVFLAVELRQANRLAESTIRNDITDSWNAQQDLVIGNEQWAQVMTKIRDPDATFSPVETEQIEAYAARVFNTWLAIHEAYENELVSEDAYYSFVGVAARSVDRVGVVPHWLRMIEASPRVHDFPIFAHYVEMLEK